MANGNGKTFTYHDLFDQVEKVEQRLNVRIDKVEDTFTDFKDKNFKELCDQMIGIAMEMKIFRQIGYWILFALGANLIVFILHWFNIPK